MTKPETTNPILHGLNEKQKEAVIAPLSNILVLAGAGSGKTRVLVSRIAWLIENEAISPHSILAVTFTNKAASEMRERLGHLLAMPVDGLWVGTFHGLCHRLLRRHFDMAGLPREFHILDSDDQARIIKRVIAALNLDEAQWPIKQAQAFINSKKDEGLRVQHIHAETYGPMRTWLKIYNAYEAACQIAGVIDFAELLLRTLELLRDNHELLAHYQDRFKAILVDEFQDTNAVQYAWCRLLVGDRPCLMAVGDDDQSIYGWRGAKVENIQQITRDFKNTNIIRLEQNYRSTATILSAANALITHNNSRMGKDLWTAGKAGEKITVYAAYSDLDEARFVIEQIKSAIRNGLNPDDIAVLYRSNAQSRVLEEALLRAQIAYKIYGGFRFYERAEIKDVMAYMRLLVNVHDDTAFLRIYNFPTRGIGEKTLDELTHQAKIHASSLWEAALLLLQEKRLSERAHKALADFVHLITRLQEQIIPMELDMQLQTVINASGLVEHYTKGKGGQAQTKEENLQELVNAASEFKQLVDEDHSLLVDFLAYTALEAGEMQNQTTDKTVHLMTLHAAKGLEFLAVFMVGMEEGIFPGKQSFEEPKRLEEERRLCYVGMTRAKETLTISYAEERRLYGRTERHRPSRFLRELPEEYLYQKRLEARVEMPKFQSYKSSQAEEAGLRLGQTVHHAKFGDGVVLAVDGHGDNTRVQVSFSGDSKWLMLAYAKLVVH